MPKNKWVLSYVFQDWTIFLLCLPLHKVLQVQQQIIQTQWCAKLPCPNLPNIRRTRTAKPSKTHVLVILYVFVHPFLLETSQTVPGSLRFNRRKPTPGCPRQPPEFQNTNRTLKAVAVTLLDWSGTQRESCRRGEFSS